MSENETTNNAEIIKEKSITSERENRLLDCYEKAASIVKDYKSKKGWRFDSATQDLKDLYDKFNRKFSPETLKRIPDKDLLITLFYSEAKTGDSLCHWLEFNQDIRRYCGGIAGGSAYKYKLYQRRKDGAWVTGSASKPKLLNYQEALDEGRSIRDKLVLGAEIIAECGDLSTAESYEQLDTKLRQGIGDIAGYTWVHKYFHMIFPDKFITWHLSEMQKHYLFAYGVKPSDKLYGSSGQLAIIARLAGMSVYEFSSVTYAMFGERKTFLRLGTSDGQNGSTLFATWKAPDIACMGFNEAGDMRLLEDDKDKKKTLAERLVKPPLNLASNIASRKAGELLNFYEANQDSVFVAVNGQQLLALGDQVQDYRYNDGQKMAHCRPVSWHYCFEKGERLPIKNEDNLTTCVPITETDNLLYLYHKYYFDLSDRKNGDLVTHPGQKRIYPLNQILYGAPGTGKTFSAIEYAMAIIENRVIEQVSPTEEARRGLMTRYARAVESGRVVFTTFHQSYGYEEFMQGIRPDIDGDSIKFKKVDGIFKTVSEAAGRDPNNNYVIIVDEINRGNISKIFGEIITLIEEDKRRGEINQLTVTLPMGESFSVPNNLYVIGTMNSADKSISLIDTALRRRFSFIEFVPQLSLIADEKLRGVLKRINEGIAKELNSTDLLIGHSYFMGKNTDDLCDIMNHSVIPLLYEYFFDNRKKVQAQVKEAIVGMDVEIETGSAGRIRLVKKGSV